MTAPKIPVGWLDPPGIWQGLARAPPADFMQFHTWLMFSGTDPVKSGRWVWGHFPEPCHTLMGSPSALMRWSCGAGFFEDKDKDAKARGIAPPKKKDPNEEFKNFMESIDADVQDAEGVAAEEAAEEALERDQLDDFEQRYLIYFAPDLPCIWGLHDCCNCSLRSR